MAEKSLRDHVVATYVTLRIGIAVLAVLLPLLLWIGGHLSADLPLQHSMSAYYHAGGGAMRNWFVGILWAVGAFLGLYKGFSPHEDWALNFAGVLLVLTGMVPMGWEPGEVGGWFSPHAAFAVSFFIAIAYVCVFRAKDTLSLIHDAEEAERFHFAYRAMGLAMIVSPLAAVLLSLVLQPGTAARSTVFFVEMLGVLVFAAYWITKSVELKRSCADVFAAEGRLNTEEVGPADVFGEISLEVAE